MLFISMNVAAQDYSNLELIENKGQWPEQVKFKATTSVGAFFLQKDGYKMLLHNKEDLNKMTERMHGHSHGSGAVDSNLSYKSSNTSNTNSDKFTLRSHAYEMKFLHASASPQIIPDKPLEAYNNYFIGNDPSKWASNCKIYQAVSYKNVYPGVDVRYYTSEGRLKYDIIVNPGAAVDKIAMHFDGVDGLEVRNEKLVIKTSVDDVLELKPYTYQPLSSGRKEISNQYQVKGNIVTFKLGNYDKSKTLIIDPTLIFSTFSGSTKDNWGYTATYDKDGNFYGGGIVFGDGFPTSTGAFQEVFQGGTTEGNGGYDMAIIKFNPTGTNRIYATLIGGSTGNEQPHSIIVDDAGNLIIGGRTNSSNYPGTLYGSGGNWDIILTKLNATGTALIGSRIIGGPSEDGVNVQTKQTQASSATNRNYGDDARSEVMVDGAGNIYLASSTRSSGFPVTAGAFQTTFGGIQDGIILKTTPDLNTIIFSSFLGGDGTDAAFVLALNPSNGNIYTAGGTTSSNFPRTTAGPAINQTFQGGLTDGFVSIISPDGSNLIKSTYLGTSGNDIIYGIQFDRLGFPYVMGTYTSPGTWPVINAAYSNPGGKQFIAKLQPDLSNFIYSTVFGKTSAPASVPDISPVAFLVDRCENVYVSGWGGTSINGPFVTGQSTDRLPVTANALRTTTDGNDFYIFVLERNAQRQLYGTYWGAINGNTGDHVDGGTSRFDENGVIYMAQCGHCSGGGTFPTTAGAWSTNNKAIPNGGGGQCNLAAVKIAMELAGVSTGVKSFVNGSPRRSGCIPLTVDFNDTLELGQQYIWNFGDGSADETTTTATNSHTYNNIGTYTVRLISVDSSTCNIRDTSYTTITVRQDIAVLNGYAEKQPPCENLTYVFNNTSIPPAAPGKPFTNQSFKWDFGDGTTTIAGMAPVSHTYAARGTYNVKLILVDTNYCNYPDTLDLTLRISENVDAEFTTPPFGCAPYTTVFDNTSAGGASFQWDFGDGTTSSDEEPTHLYNTPGDYTIKLIVIDSNTCNIIDSSEFTITVSGSPTAGFNYSPNPPEINTAVEFVNTSTGGTSYLWRFGDGDSLFTIQHDTIVRHFYNATGNFNTCLIVSNQYGCTDTVCTMIAARVIPALDVPSAFTPNADGVNDKVYVRGFAIGKMTWRIYNRWGQLVFTTTNRHEGWDGKYKGILQPQEVYTYTLDLEFTDGTKAIKTGDITLLR